MKPIPGLVALCLAGLTLAPPARAHEGEDHQAARAPAGLTTPLAPRASAGSEEFELVAALAGGKLTLYLDHHGSNAPVADARVELESGAFKAVATRTGPGEYSIPAEGFARPGRYPLVFSIQTPDSADLLTTTLDVPGAPAPHAHGEDRGLVWGAAGALLLAGVGAAVIRRRGMKRG